MSTPPTDNSVGTEELSILVFKELPEQADHDRDQYPHGTRRR